MLRNFNEINEHITLKRTSLKLLMTKKHCIKKAPEIKKIPGPDRPLFSPNKRV